MSNELLIDVKETAKRLSCGLTFVWEHINKGSFRTVKLGKKRLVDVASLETFVASLADASGANHVK